MRRFDLINRAQNGFYKFIGPADDGSKKGLFWLFVMAALAVAIIFLLAIVGAFKGADWGQFGDFVGGTLNPVLTFLTFMGLLITIVLQQAELKDTRLELKRSADALEVQIRSINQQNFENTFFQMLALHNTIVDSMDVHRRNQETLRGRDCFRHFVQHLKSLYKNNENNREELEKIISAHEKFWENFQQDLAHYYRYLYNLIRIVDSSEIEDKAKYIRILRAQISDFELILLFYNGLTERAVKFKEYIEKYTLFDNLPKEHLLSEVHRELYKKSAFDEEKA